MTPIRFVSWNLSMPSAARLQRQLDFLAELEPDAVALQEVSAAAFGRIAASDVFPHAWNALGLRPPLEDETTARGRSCAILAGRRLEPASEPEVLIEAAAPERSLAIQLVLDGTHNLGVASFHQVAGSDLVKWGPAKKAMTFRAIAAWLAAHPTHGIAGMDVNSPELDHPDVSKNIYFWSKSPHDQDEHLLHDPERAPHGYRDAFRLYLETQPEKLARIRELRPEGPLATSHVVRGNARRFDFVYVTPDVEVKEVRYLRSALDSSGGPKLSDHAPVVADLGLMS